MQLLNASLFRRVLASAAVSAALIATPLVSTAGHHEGGHDMAKKEMAKKEMAGKAMKADIIDVAVGAGQFNTLAAALKAAGLVDTLKSDGPFTVFAPTDAAFAKLPEGTVETLLKPENRKQLIAVLTYHVVPGKVPAKDVVKLDSADTVNGASVAIAVSDAGVRVNRARVLKTDIMASNGIIHVIDEVILPPGANSAGS